MVHLYRMYLIWMHINVECMHVCMYAMSCLSSYTNMLFFFFSDYVAILFDNLQVTKSFFLEQI